MATSSLVPSLLISLSNYTTMEKLVTVGLKKNKLMGGFPEELSRFKKLQIDVQGKKSSTFQKRCERRRSGMVDWWEPLDVCHPMSL